MPHRLLQATCPLIRSHLAPFACHFPTSTRRIRDWRTCPTIRISFQRTATISIPTQSQLALVAESNQALSRWSIQGSSAYILLLDITTLVTPCISSVLIYLVQAFRSSAIMSS